MKKTIGGDRLGSGQKMTTDLHNYGRSTHNLTRSWKSSMAPGVLYPCMVDIALKGDTWDINCDSLVRTIPTKGPLFGSFKYQVDVFVTPVRLYNRILHNNPTDIGLKMAEVKIPVLEVEHKAPFVYGDMTQHVANNALLKYLGISGYGKPSNGQNIVRQINAWGALCYFDIYKNYFSNKQEENGYYITAKADNYGEPYVNNAYVVLKGGQKIEISLGQNVNNTPLQKYVLLGDCLNKVNIEISLTRDGQYDNDTLQGFESKGLIQVIYAKPDHVEFFVPTAQKVNITVNEASEGVTAESNEPHLQSFPIKNIDNMREQILTRDGWGTPFKITRGDNMPYGDLCDVDGDGRSMNSYAMNGLAIKTYQSDLFNNWLRTDWIDGTNGVNEITKVMIEDDALKLDDLNLAQKVYNLLNRVVVSGGTYEDWLEATSGEKAIRRAETPIYCGGMSSEIIFDEVIQTSAGETDDSALGALGGRGRLIGKKGGRIHIKVQEPSIIMAICSITPRLDYTQGNKWFNTELQSLDDLHKPALTGIGFQELITEQMAWFETTINTQTKALTKHSAGKQPAWINYMTAYDEAFGDFADVNGKSYMVLGRQYEMANNGRIADLTTYIDPKKYNYAFAYSDLTAQNFWVQNVFEVKARRIMSAKIIPNL